MKKDLSQPSVIVALDYDCLSEAYALVDQLDPTLCCLKIGKNMFTRFGPDVVRTLQERGFPIFLDLKFHDTPNTVADACYAAAELGVWMVNVHIAGGVRMLQAAREAVDRAPKEKRPLLVGVTVLTSMDDRDLSAIGVNMPVKKLVEQYAILAKEAGLDGVVCSAQEAKSLRALLGENFLLVSPGIRLPKDKAGGQKRIMTPEKARAAGVDYLVVGRSITQSDNPLEVLQKVTTLGD